MLIYAATIVQAACEIIVKWPDEPQVRLAALKCIDAITDLGIKLPIQHVVVIAKEATCDHAECAALAQHLYEKQDGDMLFSGKGLIGG
jgi:hypothetical protein